MSDLKLWLDEVDDILFTAIGLGHMDLRDRLWYDAFADGLSPEEAVEELVGSTPEEMMENELYD